jgi:hypothetical protein
MGAALAVLAVLALVLGHHVVLGHGGGWVSAAAEEGGEKRKANGTLPLRPLTLPCRLEIRAGTRSAQRERLSHIFLTYRCRVCKIGYKCN